MAFRPPLVWLMIYVLTAPISLYDYVVCISLDGHIELETAHDGKYTTLLLSLYETLHQSETDGHCSRCLDISILITNPNQHCICPSQEPVAIKTDIVRASWIPPTTFGPRLTGNTLSIPQCYLNPLHLQTAVLRL